MSGILQSLPAGFAAYARSPDLTSETLPAELQAAHTAKAGTWALLHVLEGTVLYKLEPPRAGQRLVTAGDLVMIEAEVFHHVRFIEPGRFFYRIFPLHRPCKGVTILSPRPARKSDHAC